MSRQDANAAFALTSFLYGGNAAYVDELYARYEPDPNPSMPNGRPSSEPERRRPRRREERAGPAWSTAGLADRCHATISSPRSTATGRQASQALGAKLKAQGAEPRRRASAADCRARDARFGPRAHDDPRLSHARPSPRQSRSAGPRTAAATTRSSIRRPTASPKPTTTARSSSTRCSGSNRDDPRDARRSCAAPIAARSAWSTCISPIRPRKPGCRSASRARTRRSPSPARARSRSSTSWSKPKASKNSSTCKFTGTKRFGLDGGEGHGPGAGADHQARRRARRAARSSSACRIAAASTCSPR